MNFILKYILLNFWKQWLVGIFIVIIFNLAFVTLPYVAGWFLVVCSTVFITQNTIFTYLFPSAIIRFIAVIRTITKYFDKTINHKTLLDAELDLQTEIYQSVQTYPYHHLRGKDNLKITQIGLVGIESISNYVLLWMIPLISFLIVVAISVYILWEQNVITAFIYSLLLVISLLVLPTFFLFKNRLYHDEIFRLKENHKKALTTYFEASIEIEKYGLQNIALKNIEEANAKIVSVQKKVQRQNIWVQYMVGLALGLTGILILYLQWESGIAVEDSVGIFLGLLALCELGELLWANKAHNNAIKKNVTELQNILLQKEVQQKEFIVKSFHQIKIENWKAKIPNLERRFSTISLEIKKAKWTMLYGATGIGKSTFLNSLFYTEYQIQVNYFGTGNP